MDMEKCIEIQNLQKSFGAIHCPQTTYRCKWRQDSFLHS